MVRNRTALLSLVAWLGWSTFPHRSDARVLPGFSDNQTEEDIAHPNGCADYSSAFPYVIPYSTTQSCDIFGPVCQTGMITLGSKTCTGTDYSTATVTRTCSEYLASQLAEVNAHRPGGYDWHPQFGRSRQCRSYADNWNKTALGALPTCTGFKRIRSVSPSAAPYRYLNWSSPNPRDLATATASPGDYLPDPFLGQGNTDCCGFCFVRAGEVVVHYYQDPYLAAPSCERGPASNSHTRFVPYGGSNSSWSNFNGRDRRRTSPVVTAAPQPTIFTHKGVTMTAPTMYVEFIKLPSLNDVCGFVQPIPVTGFLAIPPGQLSTMTGKASIGQEYVEFDYKSASNHMYYLQEKMWPTRVEVSDLACPTFGVGFSLRKMHNVMQTITTVGPPYHPLIAPPNQLLDQVEGWRDMCRGELSRVLFAIFGIIDPPFAHPAAHQPLVPETNPENPDSSPTPLHELSNQGGRPAAAANSVDHGLPSPTADPFSAPGGQEQGTESDPGPNFRDRTIVNDVRKASKWKGHSAFNLVNIEEVLSKGGSGNVGQQPETPASSVGSDNGSSSFANQYFGKPGQGRNGDEGNGEHTSPSSTSGNEHGGGGDEGPAHSQQGHPANSDNAESASDRSRFRNTYFNKPGQGKGGNGGSEPVPSTNSGSGGHSGAGSSNPASSGDDRQQGNEHIPERSGSGQSSSGGDGQGGGSTDSNPSHAGDHLIGTTGDSGSPGGGTSSSAAEGSVGGGSASQGYGGGGGSTGDDLGSGAQEDENRARLIGTAGNVGSGLGGGTSSAPGGSAGGSVASQSDDRGNSGAGSTGADPAPAAQDNRGGAPAANPSRRPGTLDNSDSRAQTGTADDVGGQNNQGDYISGGGSQSQQINADRGSDRGQTNPQNGYTTPSQPHDQLSSDSGGGSSSSPDPVFGSGSSSGGVPNDSTGQDDGGVEPAASRFLEPSKNDLRPEDTSGNGVAGLGDNRDKKGSISTNDVGDTAVSGDEEAGDSSSSNADDADSGATVPTHSAEENFQSHFFGRPNEGDRAATPTIREPQTGSVPVANGGGSAEAEDPGTGDSSSPDLGHVDSGATRPTHSPADNFHSKFFSRLGGGDRPVTPAVEEAADENTTAGQGSSSGEESSAIDSSSGSQTYEGSALDADGSKGSHASRIQAEDGTDAGTSGGFTGDRGTGLSGSRRPGNGVHPDSDARVDSNGDQEDAAENFAEDFFGKDSSSGAPHTKQGSRGHNPPDSELHRITNVFEEEEVGSTDQMDTNGDDQGQRAGSSAEVFAEDFFGKDANPTDTDQDSQGRREPDPELHRGINISEEEEPGSGSPDQVDGDGDHEEDSAISAGETFAEDFFGIADDTPPGSKGHRTSDPVHIHSTNTSEEEETTSPQYGNVTSSSGHEFAETFFEDPPKAEPDTNWGNGSDESLAGFGGNMNGDGDEAGLDPAEAFVWLFFRQSVPRGG